MVKHTNRTEFFVRQLSELENDLLSAKRNSNINLAKDIMNEAVDLLGQDRAFDIKYAKRVQDLIYEAESYIADMDYERD